MQARTRAPAVDEVLGAVGVALVGEDYVVPAGGQPIPTDGHIKVVRVREEILTDQQLIPFDTTYHALPNVEIDTIQLIQAGVPGVHRNLTRVRYEIGGGVSRVAEAAAQVQ